MSTVINPLGMGRRVLVRFDRIVLVDEFYQVAPHGVAGALDGLGAAVAKMEKTGNGLLARGDSNPNGANRFLWRAATGAGDARGCDGIVAAQTGAGTFGHLTDGLLADGTVVKEGLVAHTKGAFLHLVAVSHYAAAVVLGGSSHGSELRGEGTASATLGSGKGGMVAFHGVGHQFREGFEVFAHDILASDGIELRHGTVNLLLEQRAVVVAAAGCEAQFEHARLRQVGQSDGGGQGELPRFDEVGQEGLANALDEDVLVDNLIGAEMGLQPGNDFGLHEIDHFERNTGHGDHHLALIVEPHARSRAEDVVDHGAAARNPCLLAVDGGELIAAGVKDALDVGKGFLVLVKLAVEEIAEGLLGDVVLGGAEAAGDEHHIAPFDAMTEVEIDVVGTVASDKGATNVDACGNEHLRHGAGICIDNLPNQQFVAYVEDSCFHDAKVRKKQKTERIF